MFSDKKLDKIEKKIDLVIDNQHAIMRAIELLAKNDPQQSAQVKALADKMKTSSDALKGAIAAAETPAK